MNTQKLLSMLDEDAILVAQIILGSYALKVINTKPIYGFVAVVLLVGSAFLRSKVKKTK